MFIRAITAAVVVASAFVALPALAETVDRVDYNVEVRYGDLDLSTASGAAELHERIARAARTACGVSEARTLQDMQAAKACRTAALDRATPRAELAVAAARRGEAYAANRNDAVLNLGR